MTDAEQAWKRYVEQNEIIEGIRTVNEQAAFEWGYGNALVTARSEATAAAEQRIAALEAEVAALRRAEDEWAAKASEARAYSDTLIVAKNRALTRSAALEAEVAELQLTGNRASLLDRLAKDGRDKRDLLVRTEAAEKERDKAREAAARWEANFDARCAAAARDLDRLARARKALEPFATAADLFEEEYEGWMKPDTGCNIRFSALSDARTAYRALSDDPAGRADQGALFEHPGELRTLSGSLIADHLGSVDPAGRADQEGGE